MKLRLTLILFCLLCIGLFASPQDKKKTTANPTVENGPDVMPFTVTSKKKAHRQPPPPPPVMIHKDGKPLPPPKVEAVKFSPPKIVKDAPKPPPPPPAKPTKTEPPQPILPDASVPPERTDLS